MRTTVSISDEVLIAAKRRAHDRGVTLGHFIDVALQRELNDPGPGYDAPPVPVYRGGTGPRAGVDLSSNRALHEALDEGVPLDGLR